MAGFLPEHLPYEFDRRLLTKALSSPTTPTHRSRPSSNHQSPSDAQSSSAKRRSVLGIALQQITPSKLFHKKSPSTYRYTTSRASQSLDGLELQYRCDVMATSANDFRCAEEECKQLIIEAGGKILDNYQYPGGFLFELSCLAECPLETGDKTAEGGTIVVEMCDPFYRHHSRQQSSADTMSSIVESKKSWSYKSTNKLQKKCRPVNEAIETSQQHHPQFLGFGTGQVSLVDMLLEEARKRRENSAPRNDDADWVTLPDEDE